MGTILGKGFPQAQVHTEFIARVPNIPMATKFPVATKLPMAKKIPMTTKIQWQQKLHSRFGLICNMALFRYERYTEQYVSRNTFATNSLK